MMNARQIFCAALLAGTISCPAAEEPLSRIAFGSCANEHRPQPVWQAINELKPQLFIFTGDNVYADTADPAKLQESYELLAAEPEFAKLRAGTPILATWDDHDYGKNDAGEEFEGKQAAAEARRGLRCQDLRTGGKARAGDSPRYPLVPWTAEENDQRRAQGGSRQNRKESRPLPTG
jgi:phosphodiesterase/alkaline phosphatase D-like protein